MTDKMKTERTKVNLEADRARLLGEKNSLVVKREEFWAEIAMINATGSSNAPIHSQQDPLLKLARDKFKAKRPPLFNGLKENLQGFFTRIRYY